MTNFEKVGLFMKTFGQEVKLKPDFATDKINELRVILIVEELDELKIAVKNHCFKSGEAVSWNIHVFIKFWEIRENQLLFRENVSKTRHSFHFQLFGKLQYALHTGDVSNRKYLSSPKMRDAHTTDIIRM